MAGNGRVCARNGREWPGMCRKWPGMAGNVQEMGGNGRECAGNGRPNTPQHPHSVRLVFQKHTPTPTQCPSGVAALRVGGERSEPSASNYRVNLMKFPNFEIQWKLAFTPFSNTSSNKSSHLEIVVLLIEYRI